MLYGAAPSRTPKNEAPARAYDLKFSPKSRTRTGIMQMRNPRTPVRKSRGCILYGARRLQVSVLTGKIASWLKRTSIPDRAFN